MKNPIQVKVDTQILAGYVRYSDAPVAETVDVLPTCSVAVDLDAAGDVIGIEVLHVENPDIVEAARKYAAAHGLSFPRDLAGNLVLK